MNPELAQSIEAHPSFGELAPRDRSTFRAALHARSMVTLAREMAGMLNAHANGHRRLLDVGGGRGHHALLLLDQLTRAERPTIYDVRDRRDPVVAGRTVFAHVDVGRDHFPAADGAFDVVVIHELLVELFDIRRLLAETARVLAPGGLLLVSVPNLAALHNVLLLACGRQPSTLHIAGSHVRGFAVHDFTRHVEATGSFRRLEMRGVGFHPFTSAAVPAPLVTWSHTVSWLFQRTGER